MPLAPISSSTSSRLASPLLGLHSRSVRRITTRPNDGVTPTSLVPSPDSLATVRVRNVRRHPSGVGSPQRAVRRHRRPLTRSRAIRSEAGTGECPVDHQPSRRCLRLRVRAVRSRAGRVGCTRRGAASTTQCSGGSPSSASAFDAAGGAEPTPSVPLRTCCSLAISRGVMRHGVAWSIERGIPIDIYGSDWDGLIDASHVVAEHLPNEQLAAAYRSAGVVLNDHWPGIPRLRLHLEPRLRRACERRLRHFGFRRRTSRESSATSCQRMTARKTWSRDPVLPGASGRASRSRRSAAENWWLPSTASIEEPSSSCRWCSRSGRVVHTPWRTRDSAAILTLPPSVRGVGWLTGRTTGRGDQCREPAVRRSTIAIGSGDERGPCQLI